MSNLELMASSLYRIVEDKAWCDVSARDRANYLAICRQTVENVKAEKSQQPRAGQKEVA